MTNARGQRRAAARSCGTSSGFNCPSVSMVTAWVNPAFAAAAKPVRSAAAFPPHPALPRYYGPSERKSSFVRRIFDGAAPDYDRIERWMALGSGSWYRRQALTRAGLAAGMRVLDVAVGTGLVAREEIDITG